MAEQPPDPADWPEGLWLARLYAATYGLTLPEAIELVHGPPAPGWVSGTCGEPSG